MSWIEEMQKIVPFAQTLPVIAKVLISLIIVLAIGLLLLLIWTPPSKKDVTNNPLIVEAYTRMKRVLERLESKNGTITVDGSPIANNLQKYYEPYIAIALYLRNNPGNIKGANEEVWNNGGLNRSYIDDTQAFEAVVSNFAITYYEASHNLEKKQ